GGALISALGMFGTAYADNLVLVILATGGRIRLIYWKAVPPALGFFASVVAMGALFAFGALQANAVG
ncbi:MAG TPA: hypothetical protein VIQ76_08420, partial [Propionibacteriaceae bacterium]